ncbi:MAG TPA: Coq4 family protein [Kofleriaceae bacterium]|nr:Coq4 family protein [Kofleriaceae bacterium]
MTNPLLVLRIGRAALRLVRDPNRLDEVIAMADQLGNTPALDGLLRHVETLPGGKAALADRPRVDVDLPRLRALPDGTFGRETARFLDARGLDPADLPKRAAGDARAWLRAHLYESHDLWHVVTGFDTDVAGELGLQAFYLAQLPGRLAAAILAIAMTNTFLYAFDERDARMDAVVRGWQLGKTARPLLAVRWADLWELPLAEVRARLGLGDAATARPVAAAAAA